MSKFTVVNINGTKAVQIHPNQNGMRIFKQLTFKNPIIHKIPITNLQALFDNRKISTVGKFSKEELVSSFNLLQG